MKLMKSPALPEVNSIKAEIYFDKCKEAEVAVKYLGDDD